MKRENTALVWFRRDLRLADNPALTAALAGHTGVVPVYIHAPEEETPWEPGAASRWWLHQSLTWLGRSLRERGSRLIVRPGPTRESLLALCRETGARAVYWNRLVDPAVRRRDAEIARVLESCGIGIFSFEGCLLFDPEPLKTSQNRPFTRFSPFHRACLRLGLPTDIQPTPKALPKVPPGIAAVPLEELKLLPGTGWYQGLADAWQPGEAGALARLEAFCSGPLAEYASLRDRPDLPATSRLSPHLHFGEISPRQVVAAVTGTTCGGGDAFLRELIWREFSHYLLYHFPDLADQPLDGRFAFFPWRTDEAALTAWQQGRTGIPLVDAGMRELWETGWMHNRVRMVAASFLVKNLLVPWQEGARWFWDTLVDADLGNNSQNWQWVAGCGADAAPYFRIFNPVLQGRRFDSQGDYVRRWVPELRSLPAPLIHAPWEADAGTLRSASVTLGKDYPLPLVDLRASRTRALEAFRRMRRELL